MFNNDVDSIMNDIDNIQRKIYIYNNKIVKLKAMKINKLNKLWKICNHVWDNNNHCIKCELPHNFIKYNNI